MAEAQSSSGEGTTKEEDNNGVIGKHLYGNFYGINSELLGDKDFLERLMLEAAELTGAKVVEHHAWSFGGKKGGVSVLVLVTESHLALHTWVEYGYATVDIYTCGAHTDPLRGFNLLLERLKPRRYIARYVERSSREEIFLSEREIAR
ncbi:MAG: adenosylmethionine decarboxylase [Fervidicoccaceae archaeon]